MARTTRLAKMAGMERMSADVLSRQVILQISLPLSRLFSQKHFSYRHQRMSCTRRRVKTEHLTERTTDAHFSRARDTSSTHMRCIKIGWVSESAFSQKSSCRHVFHRNLLGVLDNPPRFPDVLVTESGTTCADLRSGSWIDRTAEQSPFIGYEAKDLIEIASEHTPINFPSRKNSFSIDINDVPPTIVASDIIETIEAGQLTSPLFTQERDVSANSFSFSVFSVKREPASSSLVNIWQTV